MALTKLIILSTGADKINYFIRKYLSAIFSPGLIRKFIIDQQKLFFL
jgi:hypothetical protein